MGKKEEKYYKRLIKYRTMEKREEMEMRIRSIAKIQVKRAYFSVIGI